MTKKAAYYDLEELFHKALAAVQAADVEFALCGGIAASLYRDQPRLTNDIDFVVGRKDGIDKAAEEIVQSFGLTPQRLRQAELEGGPLFAIKKKSTPVQAIVGRVPGDQSAIGLDILLPNISWAEPAVERAKENIFTFAGDRVPVITREDLIISKLCAAHASREKDLDDLRSVFRAKHKLDLEYLLRQMRQLSLELPDPLSDVAPKEIQLVSQTIRRNRKWTRSKTK